MTNNNIPSISTPPNGIDPALYRWLSDAKTILENIGQSTNNDSANELTTEQAITLIDQRVTEGLENSGDYPAVSVTPGTITGLTARPSRSFTILSWDQFPATYDAQDIIIYRSIIDNPDAATAIGTTKTLVYVDYAQSDSTYYYWVAVQSRGSIATPEGIIGAKNTDIPTISSEINSLITIDNIDDFFAEGAITPDKVFALELAALSANLGDVTAGTLSNSDGTFTIDLINKFIEISGPHGAAIDDYIRIENGSIQQFAWDGVRHNRAGGLKTIEVGTAANGETVELESSYEQQPRIIVTAHDTPIYSAANSAQDQVIQIKPEDITEILPGKWTFKAVSRLVLSDGVEIDVVADTTGPGSGTINTSKYITPSNCKSVDLSLNLTSVRGTGTAPKHNKRKVSITVYYRKNGTSDTYSKITAPSRDIGSTRDSILFNYTATFVSSDEWQFYVRGVFSDAGGTFNAGDSGYEYLPQVTLFLGSNSSVGQAFANSVSSVSQNKSITFPSFSPTSTYSVYDVDYTISYGYYVQAFKSGSSNVGYGRVYKRTTNTLLHNINGSSGGAGAGDFNLNGATKKFTFSKSTFSKTHTVFKLQAKGIDSIGDNGTPGIAKVKVFAAGTKAVIKQRRLKQNSQTSSNKIKINDFSFSLTGGTQLNAGTLGWTAIL